MARTVCCANPSHAGGLLAEVGIAVTAANWVSVAVFVVARMAIIAWRIQSNRPP
jgi:hypothetical protein